MVLLILKWSSGESKGLHIKAHMRKDPFTLCTRLLDDIYLSKTAYPAGFPALILKSIFSAVQIPVIQFTEYEV